MLVMWLLGLAACSDFNASCVAQNSTYEVEPKTLEQYINMEVLGVFNGDKQIRAANVRGYIEGVDNCDRTVAINDIFSINYSTQLNCYIRGPFPKARNYSVVGLAYLDGFGTARCGGNVTVVPKQAEQ
jgi:hypothetical protein